MPGLEAIGRWIIFGGVALILLGGMVLVLSRFFPNIDQIPGTIRFQSGGLTCVFPLLASILLSIFLTIVLNILARFFNR
jgi:hypothetical protein